MPKKNVLSSKIGNSLIKNLRPADRPYEIRDSGVKGLLLRVQPSGVKSFYVEYARGKRIALGRTDALPPAQARKRAIAILADVYQGKDPLEARRRARAHTFKSFLDNVYAPWAKANLRAAKPTVRRLKAAFPDIQDKKLDEITPWLIEKWRMARTRAGLKPSTVNRDLNDLQSSLNRAKLWGLLEANPIADVKRSKVDRNPAIRYLTHNEEARLRAALDAREARLRRERDSANAWRLERGYPRLPNLAETAFADHLKPMVLLSLNTGMRRGEIFSLVWPDVDLTRASLTVIGTKAKSGRTCHIPLNAEAFQVLGGWRDQAGNLEGLVFPGKHGERFNNVNKAWQGVLKMAQICAFRWHDLRHSFASQLVMAGVDLNTVRELLGHSDYAMTLRYAHLAPEHKAEAVARLRKGDAIDQSQAKERLEGGGVV